MSEQPDPLMARVPLETRSRVVELLAVIDERDAEVERLRGLVIAVQTDTLTPEHLGVSPQGSAGSVSSRCGNASVTTTGYRRRAHAGRPTTTIRRITLVPCWTLIRSGLR